MFELFKMEIAMNLKKYLTLPLATALLSGCVTTGANMVPNEKTQVFIKSTNLSKISGEIGRLCDEVNLMIADQTDHSVTCRGEAGMFANVLLGTSGGSGVSKNAQFNLIPYSDKRMTKVVVNAWFENQNAFGGVRKNDLKNNKTVNAELLTFLETVKKRVE